MNRFRPNVTLRRDVLLQTTTLGMIAVLCLTPHLWYYPERVYPLVPIVPQFVLPAVIHGLLYAVSLISLGLTLLLPSLRRYTIPLVIGTLTLLALLDYTRLQPWLLHYLAVLSIFFIAHRRSLAPTVILDSARVVVAGIYFWSGIQKMNLRFVTEIFPWFTEHLWSSFGDTGMYAAVAVGLLVPIVEACIGLGLLFRRTRNYALSGATLMIIIVLASIGPFGHDWNISVWPWNVALYISALALFWRMQCSATELWHRCQKHLLAIGMIAIFWLYPIGNWFGLSDYYLSWSLYSGRVPEGELVGDPALLRTFSDHLTGDDTLYLQSWSVDELNTAPYPEVQAFEQWFASLCTSQKNPPLTLTIHTFTRFENDKTLACE